MPSVLGLAVSQPSVACRIVNDRDSERTDNTSGSQVSDLTVSAIEKCVSENGIVSVAIGANCEFTVASLQLRKLPHKHHTREMLDDDR
jgi:hypothetical protein